MALLHILFLTIVVAVAAAGADELTAKPLPGNKPCSYPPEAQSRYVAGPVRFVAHVHPDGTPDSVDVQKVPGPGLGFEDTIRTCISEWRFEPASPGVTSLRSHEGRIRFRIDPKEEAAVRTLLESLAAAWNAGDMKAVDDLGAGPAAGSSVEAEPRRSLHEQLAAHRPIGPWRMELDPDVERIQFLEPTAVNVRQGVRRVTANASGGPSASGEESVLDVYAAKGGEGWRWRLVTVFMRGNEPIDPVRVGGRIREPRKVKDARPVYPESMKLSRIQGAVILEAVISPAGKVTDLKVLRGIHPHLDAAAVEAVRKWEYTPTLLEGVAVPVIMTVVVNFRLS